MMPFCLEPTQPRYEGIRWGERRYLNSVATAPFLPVVGPGVNAVMVDLLGRCCAVGLEYVSWRCTHVAARGRWYERGRAFADRLAFLLFFIALLLALPS